MGGSVNITISDIMGEVVIAYFKRGPLLSDGH
jgi:hypothetical protein